MLGVAQKKQVTHVPVKPTSPASGEEMYMNYCAACHGKDGKGGGPAADALKVPPKNLTTLAYRNAGKYVKGGVKPDHWSGVKVDQRIG